jgi:hypothetical protein
MIKSYQPTGGTMIKPPRPTDTLPIEGNYLTDIYLLFLCNKPQQ